MSSEVWKLVLIEGNPDDRVEIRRLLAQSERCLEVQEATSGDAGLSLVLAPGPGPPDCVILDFRLPDMEAPEIIHRLTGSDGLVVCPVVVLTGTTGSQAGRAVLRAGAQDYLGKEWITPQGLTRAIENAVERHQMARETRQRELALAASEVRFRTLFDHATDSIFLHDDRGAVLEVNRAAREALGCTREELIGRYPFDFDPGVSPQHLARHLELLEDGQLVSLDSVNRRKDGSTFPVEVRVRPFRVDGRRFALAIVRDISERMRAIEDLQNERDRFRNLINGLPDAIFINSGGRVVFCNPACLRLLGAASPAEVLGKTPFDLHPPEFHEIIRSRIETLLANRAPLPGLEKRVTRLDGRTVPVFVTAVPLADRGVDALLVVLRDLTEQKRIEQQLRHQELLLREAAELAHFGGWNIDPRTGQVEWTEETARIHDLDHPTPSNIDFALAFYEPEDRDRLREAVFKALAAGTPYDLELRLRTAAGRKKWVRTICRPVMEDGRPVLVRGSIQDITDRRQLEDQFRQAQKMEAVGRLAGGVAHDFNNLLTVINGYCDLLLMTLPAGSRGEDDHRASVLAIREAGERAARVTSQLLAFSRKAIVEPRVLDLEQVVVHTEKLLRRLIGEDVLLAVRSSPDAARTPCRIEADPSQIDQMIVNLAVNARDAMPQGGRLTLATRPIEIASDENTWSGELPAGSYVELEVSDTGCGMSDEVKARIFEPFFTTKEVGRGTGLGLAVVHGVVQQAGGGIQVDSAVGVGTTFRLLFPRVAEPPGAARDLAGRAGEPARGTESVLIAEDEDSVRLLCRIALESQGYRVQVASSGREAMLAALQHPGPLHLLVTDVVMPEMSGRELADAIRAAVPGVRVLFISGYTDDEVFRRGVREATDAFLQKPFTPLGLTRKVREVLDDR